MLTRLVINDVVLIEKLALPLERGLNVFTGETGAGKSILLDALSLALGGRSDAGLVRPGASQASVAAEFQLEPDHSLFKLSETHGLNSENPIILRRVVGKDGKSRAFFNDQPISIALLKSIGESLLEIHGQFETHGLLNPATHRGLLDDFTGLVSLKQKVAIAFAQMKEREALYTKAKDVNIRNRAEEDFLHSAVLELDDLAPQSGEADRLAAKRKQLQYSEKILESLNIAIQALDSGHGAIARLAQAGKALARVTDKASELLEILARIDRASDEAHTASQDLGRFMASLDADPGALQKIEERLFALRALARKHNVQVDELEATRFALTERLSLLVDEGGQIAKLGQEAAKARQIYLQSADELSAKRSQSAEILAKAISKELPPLKLERAQITIDVAKLPQDQWSEEGQDRVTFLATTNMGAPPGPLQKIASGGELARFMLALKTVLSAANPVPVLVFDEVDTGIGGAIASAVGERLALLSQHVQILVVTHSPQVAARAFHHLKVVKHVSGKQTVTEVEVLGKAERREELARMLAGTAITDAARHAADSLLSDQDVKPDPAKEKSRKKRA